MILYHSSDLIWATKIKGTADALGLAARPVRSVAMLEARLAEGPIRALIVDLDAAETALELIRRVRTEPSSEQSPEMGGWSPRIRILAFGPHVATESFAAAREAGADEVMARGAFGSRMPQVLAKLAG